MSDNIIIRDGAGATVTVPAKDETTFKTPIHINKPYAVAADCWSYAAGASGIVNTTTAVTVKAAAGSGIRNYVTGIHVVAQALGAVTELVIRDGAGGAVLFRIPLPTTGTPNGVSMQFATPLKGTANTLLEICTLTATVTGGVYVNMSGYVAA